MPEWTTLISSFREGKSFRQSKEEPNDEVYDLLCLGHCKPTRSSLGNTSFYARVIRAIGVQWISGPERYLNCDRSILSLPQGIEPGHSTIKGRYLVHRYNLVELRQLLVRGQMLLERLRIIQ